MYRTVVTAQTHLEGWLAGADRSFQRKYSLLLRLHDFKRL